MLRVSSGFQTLENNKTIRPVALWFQMFLTFGNLMKPEARVFEIYVVSNFKSKRLEGSGNEIGKVSASLKCVQTLRMESFLNLLPLYTYVSRKLFLHLNSSHDFKVILNQLLLDKLQENEISWPNKNK